MDYFTIPDKWFEVNMKIKKDFPDLILIPDLWIEYGVTAEPSGFGGDSFYENNTPSISISFIC